MLVQVNSDVTRDKTSRKAPNTLIFTFGPDIFLIYINLQCLHIVQFHPVNCHLYNKQDFVFWSLYISFSFKPINTKAYNTDLFFPCRIYKMSAAEENKSSFLFVRSTPSLKRDWTGSRKIVRRKRERGELEEREKEGPLPAKPADRKETPAVTPLNERRPTLLLLLSKEAFFGLIIKTQLPLLTPISIFRSFHTDILS